MSQPLSGIEGPLAKAIELAQEECVRLGHSAVDVPHFFVALLHAFPEPAQKLFSPVGLRREDLAEAVRAALPPGSDRGEGEERPDGTPELMDALRVARDSMKGGAAFRLEHGVVGVLRQADNLPKRVLASFGVDPKGVETAALAILAASSDSGDPDDDASPSPGPAVVAPPAPKRDSILAQLSRDLVEIARDGRLDPVIGRDREIHAVLETLARRSKNNPVLLGEPGVGKSAIVEGLAQRIAAGEVPKRLRDLRLHELSTADLVAGTQYRGDFEARILKLVEETAADPNVVLFIDEIHTILSAGGQQGTGDAASLLKPHLARGDVRCIGATTTDEFRKFIEKDRALVRRFQPINVPEPTQEECVHILEGLAPRFEEHHGVALEKKALEAAVRLSVKHLPERHLPDKAIDLIDQACARKVLAADTDTEEVEPITATDIADLLRDQLGKSLGEVSLDESAKLLGIEEFLRSRVVGQDHVAERVADRLRLTKRELDFRPERPYGVFLFLGPTGVGKTEVARCLSEYMLGSPNRLLRYDLSEFAEPHSVAKIIGSPPGYVGYEDEGHQ
ncbi:MAG: AAA family ATPase, partial [Planctomycetota bacterium JB042]